MPSMLYIVGWNTACTYNLIPNVLHVAFLYDIAAYNIRHKQCNICERTRELTILNLICILTQKQPM